MAAPSTSTPSTSSPSTSTASSSATKAPVDLDIPFASAAADLLQYAAQPPARGDVTAPVEILLDDVHYRFDDEGAHASQFRRVFVVRHPAGAEPLRSMAAPYAPWFEKKPIIRARVIHPSGKVHWLRASDVKDVGGLSEEGALITDRRQVVAMLPRFVPGTVVEVVTEMAEWRPYFAAGTVQKALLSRTLPTRRVRVSLDVPQAFPFRFSVRGLNLQPTLHRQDGRVVRVFDVEHPPAPPALEPMAPAHQPRTSFVAFSTGKSWNHIARAYAAFVDDALATDGSSPLVSGFSSLKGASVDKRKQVVETLLLRLRRRVKYTGLELGEAAVLPHSTQQILQRGLGDCKDQSTLLVEALRALDVDAHVALLRTAPDPEVPPHLPGVGLFNHAIVFVRGEEGQADWWIDPTYVVSGAVDVPANLQGRRALVAADDTQRLRTITRRAADTNRYVEVREIHLQDQAPAQVLETTRAEGTIAHALRQFFASREDAALEQNFTAYVKRTYGASTLTHMEQPQAHAFDEPFWLRLETDDAMAYRVDEVEGSLRLAPDMSWGFLPRFVVEADAPRALPLWLREPHHAEVVVRLHLPPGYRFGPLPRGMRKQLSDAYVARDVRLVDDDLLEVRYVVHTGEGRFSASRATAFADVLRDFRQASRVRVSYRHDAAVALRDGQLVDAIALLQASADREPWHAAHHERLATALLQVGLGAAAKQAARQAVDAAPQRARAHMLLGWSLLHDDLGRLLHVGMDKTAAEHALVEAQRLAPRHPGIDAQLGLLHLHGSLGGAMASDADLERAVAHLSRFRERTDDEAFDVHLARAMLRLGRFADATDVLTSSKAKGRMPLLIAAIAAHKGAPAAAALVDHLTHDDDERQNWLLGAARELPAARLYAPAADVLVFAAQITDDVEHQRVWRQRSRRLRRVSTAEDCLRDASGEQRMLLTHVAKTLSTERIADARARRHEGQLLTARRAASFADKADRFMAFADEEGLSLPFIRDTTVCQMDVHVEHHTPDGARRVSRLTPDEPVVGVGGAWWVVDDDDGVRLLPPGPEADAFVARHALRAVTRGDDHAVAFWLSEAPKPPAELVTSSKQRSALQVVALKHRAGLQVRIDAFDAEIRDWLLWQAMSDGDIDLHSAGFHVDTERLLSRGEVDRVEQMAQLRLAEHVGDAEAMERLAQASLHRGDIAAGQALLRRLTQRQGKNPARLNALAWNRLFLKSSGGLDDAIGNALMANAMTDFSSSEHLRTLATLFAESGRHEEALEVLAKSVDARALGALRPEDHYILGRVAERLGLLRAAKDAYLQVKKPTELPELSAWSLAQHRLKALRQCDTCDEASTR